MSRRLTEDDGRVALLDHARAKADDARRRLLALDTPDAVWRLLDDRAVARYPVGVRFDAAPLEPGEFAYPAPLGQRPADGFCLFIHPRYQSRPDTWPAIVGYYLPTINYGEIATEAEAEAFGAGLTGLSESAYYDEICRIADLGR